MATHAETEAAAAQSLDRPSTPVSSFEAGQMTPPEGKQEEEPEFLDWGWRLFVIVASLMLGVFCMALDNTVSQSPKREIRRKWK